MISTDDAPGIEWIKEKTKAADYHISEHIIRDFLTKKVTIREIEDAIANGRIIEIHRHPEKGASALLLGYAGEKPIHVMCADDQDGWLLILFAYVPARPMWKDPVNRVKEGGKGMGENLNKCFFCGGKIKQVKVGNFDYRLEGNLYVVKNIPAGLCMQCGEKYITAKASEKINRLIEEDRFGGTEEVFVLKYEQ